MYRAINRCIGIYIYVCVCVYIYIYIYIYPHAGYAVGQHNTKLNGQCHRRNWEQPEKRVGHRISDGSDLDTDRMYNIKNNSKKEK